jgi:hypothetical protein
MPAGIMGYAWVAVLHYWLQLSYTLTLLLATGMPAVWLVVFHSLMRLSNKSQDINRGAVQYSAVPSAAGEPLDILSSHVA